MRPSPNYFGHLLDRCGCESGRWRRTDGWQSRDLWKSMLMTMLTGYLSVLSTCFVTGHYYKNVASVSISNVITYISGITYRRSLSTVTRQSELMLTLNVFILFKLIKLCPWGAQTCTVLRP